MQFSFHVQSPKTSHSTKDCNSTASQCCISVEARGLLRISSPSPIRSLLHRFRQKTSFFLRWPSPRWLDILYFLRFCVTLTWVLKSVTFAHRLFVPDVVPANLTLISRCPTRFPSTSDSIIQTADWVVYLSIFCCSHQFHQCRVRLFG